MSQASQCPSTVGKQKPADRQALATEPVTGRAHWRSLDELSQTESFREFAQREFPALASELTGDSRRHFLKVMGASLALAGAATIPGCRRPDHKILPYTSLPEDIIEGRPTFYASARTLPGGGAEGVLVETFSGRPTKIEGNPLHPGTLGSSSLRGQAAVLDLYDPDRLSTPSTRGGEGRVQATWAEFDRAAGAAMSAHDADRGAGLFFLVDKTTSPTRDRVRDEILERWPDASWLPYEAIDREHEIDGTTVAFGTPHRSRLLLDDAMVIVSLDADFLGGEESSVLAQRGFGAGRRVDHAGDEMNRLYSVETALSVTGMAADHRLGLKPSQVAACAAALAEAVLSRRGVSGALLQALAARDHGSAGVETAWVDAVAADLTENAPRAVVVAGASQPPAVHALAAVMNQALGAIGRTIEYRPLTGDAAAKGSDSISTLARAVRAGRVRTLVCLDRNPLFDAPADLREELLAAWASIPLTITHAVDATETGAASAWETNSAHWLESWGDVSDWDGTISAVQPMIKPLYSGRSTIELLSGLVSGGLADGYELVRTTWRAAGADGFDRTWRRALHDGLVAGSAVPAPRPAARPERIAQAVSEMTPAGGGMEAVFVADTRLWDGRHANNGWLQEIPDAVGKVAWDNPVLMSPATAEKLGLSGWLGRIGEQTAPVVRVTVGDRAVEAPVWRIPGMADDAVVMTVGGGRVVSGHVGTGPGADLYAVRTTRHHRTASGVRLEGVGRTMALASTQDHGSMVGVEGQAPRPILREFDKQAFDKHGKKWSVYKGPYKRTREMNMAQKLGTEGHAPVPETIYEPDQRHDYSKGQQWGMSIDLNTCIGCSVCTIACQAENNIPIVGKAEVNKGREMHWIRVDRYFMGDEAHGGIGAASMPVACVHCENAPCETVCPVNATVHSPDGLNVMAYNRCIGTRYCSNNCPYKVRRFNFFDYATKKMRSEGILEGVLSNENWIPPRLREDNPQVRQMANNPDVTVRERGVMEKCTYCIQRINEARIEHVRRGKKDRVPDGALLTACQQACPTRAIVFGDINDETSAVARERESTRTYGLLEYLNTAPRTTYQARLRNPNPVLRAPVEDPFHHGGGHGDDTGGEYADEHARRDPGHIMSLSVLSTGAMNRGGRA